MLTKLIIFFIVLNLLGTFLKKIQKKQQKARQEAESSGSPYETAEQPVSTEEPAPVITDPEDLLRDIFGRLEESRPAEPPPQPVEPSKPSERPIYRTEFNPQEYHGHEMVKREPLRHAYDAREMNKQEYAKIREGKSLIDLAEAAEKAPVQLITGDEGGQYAVTLPSDVQAIKPDTGRPETRFRVRSLRDALIMSEILAPPLSLRNQ